MFRTLLLTAVAFAALAGTGCASHHGYYGYAGPPPPPRAMGPVGYAPGPGYVWVDGYYAPHGRRWAWAPGYWTRPPRGRNYWVKPYWEHRGSGYRFHRGYWTRR